MPDQAQQAELEAALARSTAKWKLVVGHHPIRSSVEDPAEAELIDRLEPILEVLFVFMPLARAPSVCFPQTCVFTCLALSLAGLICFYWPCLCVFRGVCVCVCVGGGGCMSMLFE